MTRISETDIQRYPEINRKINEWYRTIKPETQRLYSRYLIEFERTSQITLQTLLTKATAREIDPLQIRTLIIDTVKKRTNSIQVVTDSAVRKFLRYYNIIVPPTTIKYEQTQFYRAYTKQELNELLSYLDKPLEKLYVIMTAESGLRADTTLKLKWRHVSQDFETRASSIAIRLEPPFYRGKKKSGFTFVGDRSRNLLHYCTEQNLIDTKPDSNLFPFSYDSISRIIERAKGKANIDPTIKPIHGLRKYTEAQLEATKPPINERYRIMIMGRFKDIDAKNYSPRDFETLRPEYESAYRYLDYMNNAPEQTQELSNKLTEQRDSFNQRLERLENALAQRTNEALIQRATEIIDQMTIEQRKQFFEEKIMPNLVQMNFDTKIITQLTKPKPI